MRSACASWSSCFPIDLGLFLRPDNILSPFVKIINSERSNNVKNIAGFFKPVREFVKWKNIDNFSQVEYNERGFQALAPSD